MTNAVLPYPLRPSASSADNFVLPVTVRVVSPQQPRPRWQTTPAASCGYATPIADNRRHPPGAEFWNLLEQGTLGANSTIFGTPHARIRLDFQVFRERRCDNKRRIVEQGIAFRNGVPIIHNSKNDCHRPPAPCSPPRQQLATPPPEPCRLRKLRRFNLNFPSNQIGRDDIVEGDGYAARPVGKTTGLHRVSAALYPSIAVTQYRRTQNCS